MRVILKEDFVKVVEGVKVTVKARKVTVTGPRGTITKDFSHNKVDIRVMNVVGKNKKGHRYWTKRHYHQGLFPQQSRHQSYERRWKKQERSPLLDQEALSPRTFPTTK